jgi:hypothetical protein
MKYHRGFLMTTDRKEVAPFEWIVCCSTHKRLEMRATRSSSVGRRLRALDDRLSLTIKAELWSRPADSLVEKLFQVGRSIL